MAKEPATTKPETGAPADAGATGAATTTSETATPADAGATGAATTKPETGAPADAGATGAATTTSETATPADADVTVVEVFRRRISNVVGRSAALIEQLDTSPLSAGADTIRELAELVSELAASIQIATAQRD